MTVEQEPAINTFPTVNLPYVTVTLCDTLNHCQSIDHVILDTGSYGLRILASTLSGGNLQLAHATMSGQNLAECATFVQSYTWGWVDYAQVQLAAGETTSSANVPVQVIDDLNQLTVPSSCSSTGSNMGSVYGLGGNGILGVGPFVQDGGSYYQCATNTSCVSTTSAPPTSEMVSNPVAFLPVDNNGIIVQLPAVSNLGASYAYGTTTFGLGTGASIANFTALQEDSNGNFTATLSGGTQYPNSFIDTGSNRNYLTLPGTIPLNQAGDYAPASYTAYTGSLTPSSGTTSTGSTVTSGISFSIGVMDPTNSINQGMTALNDITDPGLGGNNTLADLGVPFFYGQSIALVMSGSTVSEGTGPIAAFHSP